MGMGTPIACQIVNVDYLGKSGQGDGWAGCEKKARRLKVGYKANKTIARVRYSFTYTAGHTSQHPSPPPPWLSVRLWLLVAGLPQLNILSFASQDWCSGRGSRKHTQVLPLSTTWNLLAFSEKDTCLLLCTLLLFFMKWVLEGLWLLPITFGEFWRNTMKLTLDSLGLLWFTRAHKAPEPGRYTREVDNSD